MKYLLTLLLLTFFYVSTWGQEKYVEGEILIKIKTAFQEKKKNEGIILTEQKWFNKISREIDCYEVHPIFSSSGDEKERFFIVKFSSNFSVEEVIKKFKDSPEVESAWKNRIGEYNSSDPLYSQQWGLTKIQANLAWNITSGTSDVVLGIVDSGVDLGDQQGILDPHPDLGANLWNTNQIYGFTYQQQGVAPRDVYGHGTKMAGIIGAVTNNSLGIAGVAGGGYNGETGIQILPLKMNQYFTEADVSWGIEQAVNWGAKVINISLGIPVTISCDNFSTIEEVSPALYTAVEYAVNNDVVLVAAHGNLSRLESKQCPIIRYTLPAAFDEVICVTGVNSNEIKANQANYSDWCDLSAPYEATTTIPRHLDSISPIGYGSGAGTSESAAYVSGVAGLIRSLSSDINAEMVRSILTETTDNIDVQNQGTAWYNKIGSGRLNAYNALSLLENTPASPQNLQIAWYGNHPKIKWTSNSEADIISYSVYKMITGEAGWTVVATIEHNNSLSEHSWIDDDVDKAGFLDPSYEFVYKVVAKDVLNNTSGYSNTVSIDGTTDTFWKKQANSDEFFSYSLFGNYPNPFNPSTTIKFSIAESGYVTLKVYDVLGREHGKIVDEFKEKGLYTVNFNADGLASGIYFYILNVNDYSEIKKMLLMR